jgi:hypothetical protein
MEFATISFQDIMKRLFDSNNDSKCFKKLANEYLPEQEIRLAIRRHEELRGRQKKEEDLEALARACLRDSKYRNFQCSEDVILNSILTSGVSRSSFNVIFGHMEKEKESYPTIARLLKRDADFKGREVKNTSALGRTDGVRYADFTVVKEKSLGRGFEIYSADVKVRPDAFKTFLDQAHECSLHSNYTWLVCTAGLVLDLARQWSLPPFHALEHFVDACKKQRVGIKIFDATVRELKDFAPSGESDRVSEQIKRRALQKLGFL